MTRFAVLFALTFSSIAFGRVHNLVWFDHYLWGDPLPALDAPELPENSDDKTETQP